MPQPDNKRTRGSNMPRLEGQKIAPEGTSGVINTFGVSANVAATQRTSGLQIGQQARIIDDGSSLYTALQGLAQGIEKGVQQYDYWETKIAEKKQNDWETELIEFGRTVNNNPKKMAEWSRLHAYRPNHKTAKRYNSLMADMEGKEYDAYQDDLIREVSATASKMDLSTAARYYSEEMGKLDPNDKAYGVFAEQTNALTSKMTAISQKFSDAQTSDGYDVGIFDLGAQLRANGVTAADLANERANVVAAAYNFYGGTDPQRLQINKDGSIQYTATDGTVLTGSFHGGLGDELIATIRADLGSAAGSMDDGTFNSRIAQNVLLAMDRGVFNREHTSRGSGAAGGDAIRLDLMRSFFRDPGRSVDEQRSIFVDAISLPDGATDKQRQAHTKKVIDDFIEGVIASDMSPDEKIEALNNFILVANPDNNSVQYELNGYAGNLESPDILGALDKARKEVQQINLNAGKEEAQRVDNAVHNSLDSSHIRSTRQQGLENLLRRFATVGDAGAPPTITLGDGTVLTGLDEIKKGLFDNKDAVVDAAVHIIDNSLTNPEYMGNGVWIGSQDAPAPKDVREWQVEQRRNFEAVKNLNETVSLLEQGREVAAPNAVAAFDTVLSKLPPDPAPSGVAPAINIMLGGAARQNWGKETKAAMNAKIIDMSERGSGAKLQQIFALTAEEAANFAAFTPEGLVAASQDPASAEQVIKFETIQRLLMDPETRELGQFLSGDVNGTAGWYLTDGQKLVEQYRQFHGENPSPEWLRLARNFEYMPAVNALANETVDLLWQMSTSDQGDVGRLMLALDSTQPSDDPQVIVARQLRDAWNSSQGADAPTFDEILRTPGHPDRAHLERWLQRYSARMSGAAALMSMMESTGYQALVAQQRNAAANGQVINSPTMQSEHIADMWRSAARAVAPPTGGFMTVENADAATVNTDGVQMDTRTQAVVGGIQYVRQVVTTRRAEGLTQADGDIYTVLQDLGFSTRLTGDQMADTLVLSKLAEGDVLGARTEFLNAVPNNPSKHKLWAAVMADLETIFAPQVDYYANSESRNLTDANFKIKISPKTDDVPVYIQDLIDRPFDNPDDPALKFRRVAPAGQQGPLPQTTSAPERYDREVFMQLADQGETRDPRRMTTPDLIKLIEQKEKKLEGISKQNTGSIFFGPDDPLARGERELQELRDLLNQRNDKP